MPIILSMLPGAQADQLIHGGPRAASRPCSRARRGPAGHRDGGAGGHPHHRGPTRGWRGDDGDLSLAPGEWSGELLDAVTIPAAGAEPAAPSAGAAAAAGIAALQKGEPWTIASAVDSATVGAEPLTPAHTVSQAKYPIVSPCAGCGGAERGGL